jgi:hypothetical protein
MQRITFFLAAVALAISLAAFQRATFSRADAATQKKDLWKIERHYPPLVFTSRAWLDCSISSTKNGRQAMRTASGQGFTFDTAMLPIKDGKVMLKEPGMRYKFDAFPTTAVPAHFSGLGDGTITEMKVEVEVDVKRFRQPGGPGTDIHFEASDLNADAAYVEFTGLFVRRSDKKRFPFRVLFGSVPEGQGTVTPAGPGREVPIATKMVRLGSPEKPATVTTALYEAEEDVRALQ